MMSRLKQILDSRILVVGLGKTGLSVCRYLHERGVGFEVVDDRENPPNVAELNEMVVDLAVHGSFSTELFARFETLVVSPGVPLSTPVIAEAMAQGALAIGDVELFALTVKRPVIAVTGSNGKSSVVSWIDAILKHAKLTSVLCGNIGEPVLDCIDESADVYVLELSSFQLETTVSLQPVSATVLNISEDHMDRYSGLEEYASVKRRIFKGAHHAIVNRSDALATPTAAELPDAAQNTSVWHFGLSGADEEFTTTSIEGEYWLTTPGGDVLRTSDLPLPGLHNVMNALAVLALLHPLLESNKLTRKQLADGIKTFKGLPHRTELIEERKGVRWYNDSKGTNVEAAKRAIEAMAVPVVLIAGGLGKGADFSSLREVFEAHVKALILIGRDAGLIAQVAEDLAEIHYADTMREAVAQAAQIASDGDAVLLSPACSSFDMFRNFEHRGEEFGREVRELVA